MRVAVCAESQISMHCLTACSKTVDVVQASGGPLLCSATVPADLEAAAVLLWGGSLLPDSSLLQRRG